ncbi:unnamed protein product [Amoebophrya sp. A25]|nr:unnamed protein product [Amoebophrya sp. A25]|eukprot:GSA25T00026058001.1
MSLSDADVQALAEKAADDDDYVKAFCSMPEEARRSLAAVKVLMPKFHDAEPDEQKELLDAFEPLRKVILPEAIKMVHKRLIEWWSNHEADSHQGDPGKILIELFKEINNSSLLRWVREDEDVTSKVKFLYALGSCIELSSSKTKALKNLKKMPVLQTWCQRLVQSYFDFSSDDEKTSEKIKKKGGIVEVWLEARKRRSFELWKRALRAISQNQESKAQLTLNFLQCFEPDKASSGHYPAKIFDARPGSIKLVMGERNPCFVAFHQLVEKECENKPVENFYCDYIKPLPAFSIDLGQFVKLILSVIDQKYNWFNLEADDSGCYYLSLKDAGQEKLRSVHKKLQAQNPGMVMNTVAGSTTTPAGVVPPSPNMPMPAGLNLPMPPAVLGGSGSNPNMPEYVVEFLVRNRGVGKDQISQKGAVEQQKISNVVAQKLGKSSPFPHAAMVDGLGGNSSSSSAGNGKTGGQGAGRWQPGKGGPLTLPIGPDSGWGNSSSSTSAFVDASLGGNNSSAGMSEDVKLGYALKQYVQGCQLKQDQESVRNLAMTLEGKGKDLKKLLQLATAHEAQQQTAGSSSGGAGGYGGSSGGQAGSSSGYNNNGGAGGMGMVDKGKAKGIVDQIAKNGGKKGKLVHDLYAKGKNPIDIMGVLKRYSEMGDHPDASKRPRYDQ